VDKGESRGEGGGADWSGPKPADRGKRGATEEA